MRHHRRAPGRAAVRRLRDAQVSEDPTLQPLLARYEAEIFTQVENAGIERGALQLAWDFTTGSDEHTMEDLLTARAVALEEMSRTPPVVTVDMNPVNLLS